MTDMPAAVETPDTVAIDAVKVLSSKRWMTARECWQRIDRWPHIAVRHALRALADAGEIEGRIAGHPDRPVREYRARG